METPAPKPEMSAGIAGMTAFAGGSKVDVEPPAMPDVTVPQPTSPVGETFQSGGGIAGLTPRSASPSDDKGVFPTIGESAPNDAGLPLESLLDPKTDIEDNSFQMPSPVSAPESAAETTPPTQPSEQEPEVFTPGASTSPFGSPDKTPAPTPTPVTPESSAPSAAAPAAAAAVGAASVAVADAPAEAPSATEPGKLKSGLTKRTRSATSSGPAAALNEERTAPSQRSPDQVKSMLSRYKSGLERGRGPAATDGEK